MKKIALTAIIIFELLCSLVAGMQVVEVAKANPVALSWLPTSPDTSQPGLIIQSPLQNQTFTSDEVILNFTVAKPETWFGSQFFANPGFGSDLSMYYCNGKIFAVKYSVDGIESQNISVTDANVLAPYYSPLNRTLDFSINLTLPEGKHVLTVSAMAESYYMPAENWDAFSHGGVVKSETCTIIANSTETTFYVIGTTPTITTTTPQNTTYNNTNLSLNFTVSKLPFWTAYSLDNQANTTIIGNTTLTGLTEGPHSIVVYANDTAGNMGKSDTVFFTINMPTPSPTPSPSASPTQQPTLSHSPIADGLQTEDFTISIIIYSSIALIAALAALVYFKKHTKQKPPNKSNNNNYL